MNEKNYNRIIVVGDLHGYCVPLIKLLDSIYLTEEDLMIFIGDYIDRGPESKSVIDKLIQLKSSYSNIIFLKGNHEDMMLGSMGHPASVNDLNTWLYNGGGPTLKSYGMGIDKMKELGSTRRSEEAQKLVVSHVPESHIDFFLDLKLYIETENFFFCHGGINPAGSIEQGRRNALDLLWMRDHIYAENLAWEKTVVCGHTPLHDVLIREKLICIDTGL
ncbi:MAG: serine/threonine protein phosphatase, partial [Spirochaetes bacterium]|nr:serine/threonine protein phosphatase [Spirochaetota bacterium]